MENYIKRGITLYGLREQVRKGVFTWEDAVATAAYQKIQGIEFLGQLIFPECPAINPEVVAWWKELMWKYGTKTIAHDFFVDKTMFKGRELTLCESVNVLKKHIQFAHAIDCPVIRIGGTFQPELFKEAVPILEEYGIKLGVEIHNGSSSFLLPSIQKVLDIIHRENSPYLGIVPDMSIFVSRFGEGTYFIRDARKDGVDPDFIELMRSEYTKLSNPEYWEFCDKMNEEHTNPRERELIAMCKRNEKQDPSVLLEHMPYIHHIHGKFWEMDENNEETSIDYPIILETLVKGGYKGYISAEYEGPDVEDPMEPFVRYNKMLDKYLGEYPNMPAPVYKSVGDHAQTLSSKGFKNVYDSEGKCIGFEIYATARYYRGLPLCLVENVEVTVDGVKYTKADISFDVDGTVFSFEQAATVQDHYWNFAKPMTIRVNKEGGLSEDVAHEIEEMHAFRTYYVPFNFTDRAKLTLKSIK